MLASVPLLAAQQRHLPDVARSSAERESLAANVCKARDTGRLPRPASSKGSLLDVGDAATGWLPDWSEGACANNPLSCAESSPRGSFDVWSVCAAGGEPHAIGRSRGVMRCTLASRVLGVTSIHMTSVSLSTSAVLMLLPGIMMRPTLRVLPSRSSVVSSRTTLHCLSTTMNLPVKTRSSSLRLILQVVSSSSFSCALASPPDSPAGTPPASSDMRVGSFQV